jgi:hypothetical protein
MFERSEPALRIICAALVAVLVFQAARVVLRHNPVGRMKIPDLPTLPSGTNAPAQAKGTNATPSPAAAGHGTNAVTNSVTGKTGTNAIAPEMAEKKDTNAAAAAPVLKKMETNSVAVVEAGKPGTNAITSAREERKITNAIPGGEFGKMNTNTNAVAGTPAVKPGTNGIPDQAAAKGRTNSMPGQMKPGRMGPGFGPGQMPGSKLPDLPPLIQARIDKITQSEIMAQLTKAQPAALIGIAGNGAMLRASSGQSGYVKEGGELGGLKLLRVGMNRVLVEEDGEKKELTIFSGMGGESLLSKQKEATNETITKTP